MPLRESLKESNFCRVIDISIETVFDLEVAEGEVCGPAPHVECPDCGNGYATVQGLKKHSVLYHAMRYDHATRQLLPFRSPEDLEYTLAQALMAQ